MGSRRRRDEKGREREVVLLKNMGSNIRHETIG